MLNRLSLQAIAVKLSNSCKSGRCPIIGAKNSNCPVSKHCHPSSRVWASYLIGSAAVHGGKNTRLNKDAKKLIAASLTNSCICGPVECPRPTDKCMILYEGKPWCAAPINASQLFAQIPGIRKEWEALLHKEFQKIFLW